MVQIVINGVTLEVEQGSMIIEAADEAGIKIPRFCYHKKLSIAANCRMCLVEVAGGRKPMPACATPVTEGMQVLTDSPMALEAQQAVMEFLLINHPLDCPICDQGGECELQDISMGFGSEVSRYTEGKRVVKDKSLGPLIATDMTRCIHCTRCVRFTQEIAGTHELGAVGRGEHTQIGTYIERSVDSELSGNVIDVCPVGALTSRPFRFKSRAWELKQYPSIAPHDCLGSNVYLHSKQDKIYRVVPQENEAINEVWLADRDRFSYEGINSGDRLEKPLVKINGSWQETDWQTALDKTVSGLKQAVAAGSENMAALASASSTLEELYLLQALVRGLGCDNIDHRCRQLDFCDDTSQPAYPRFDLSLAGIESQQCILLIGSNIRKEQPLAAHRVHKAQRNGAEVMAINPIAFDFIFPLSTAVVSTAGQIERDLAAVAKALNINDSALADCLDEVEPTTDHQAIAQALKQADNPCLLLGAYALTHPKAALIRALAAAISETCQGSYNGLTEGANSAGAWLAGAIPHRQAAGSVLGQAGLNAQQALANQLNAYVLLGLEPELDCANPAEALAALDAAHFVVSLSSFVSETMKSYADVILPMATFSETSGTFVNVTGTWQSFSGVTAPQGDARPGWKILRVLANLLKLEGFTYNSSAEVRDEVQAKWQAMPKRDKTATTDLPALTALPAAKSLVRLAEKPIYAADGLTRRAGALQATRDAYGAAVYLNHAEAAKHQLSACAIVRVKQQGVETTLPLCLDERIPNHSVLVPTGLVETAVLGGPYSEIELEKA